GVVGSQPVHRLLYRCVDCEPGVVLSGVWVWNGCHRTRLAPVRFAERRGHVLVLATPERLVTSLRISGRRICRGNDGRIAVDGGSLAQVEREKSEQPYSASALQRFLLFAPNAVGTRKGPGSVMLAGPHTTGRRPKIT